MSCRRAFDIDLIAFVADASGPEWADFRAHYPGCADCAAEVRAWTELHETLRVGGAAPSPHPAEATLVTYAERPDTLAANDRRSIERHVAACRLCADELTTLRRFDFATLVPAAAAEARPAAWQRGASAARGGGFAGATRRIGRVLVHPAFAYAVVLLLLVPVLVRERGALPPPPSSPREQGAVSSEDARLDKRASEVEAETRPGGAAEEPPAAAGALDDMRDGSLTEERKNIPASTLERDEATAVPPPQVHARVAAAPPAAASAPGALKRRASNAPPSDARYATLSLRTGTPAEIRSRDLDRSLRLHVSLGAEAWWRGELEMRIVGPDPGRELRQRIDGTMAARADANAAPQLDVAVPAEWLVPGAYLVEVSPANELAAAEKTQDALGQAEPNRFQRERSEQALTAPAAALRFAFTVR